MKHVAFVSRILLRGLLLITSLAFAFVSGCSSKTSPGPSTSFAGRAAGGRNEASAAINKGNQMLSDSINKTTSPFHLSYSSQENINPKFPQTAGSKPEVGPVQMEADIAPDQVSIMNNTNGKKTETKASKEDQLAMSMAKLNFLGVLVNSTFSLACGGVAARPAGSDRVGNFTADKYDIDTSHLSGPERAGFEAATAMLGARAKIESVKGSAWIDHASGLLLKFNLDTEFTDPGGERWKEHREMVITPQ